MQSKEKKERQKDRPLLKWPKASEHCFTNDLLEEECFPCDTGPAFSLKGFQ